MADNFHTRTLELNTWITREEAFATGRLATLDPAPAGHPDRDLLLRALFERWTTTLEAALDLRLERGHRGLDAVRGAYEHAAARRTSDWRVLQREADHPTLARLTREQHLRVARSAGLLGGCGGSGGWDAETAMGQVALVADGVRARGSRRVRRP